MEPSVPPVPLPLAKSWLLGGRQLHVPCYGRGWDDNDPEGKGGKGKRNGERREGKETRKVKITLQNC